LLHDGIFVRDVKIICGCSEISNILHFVSRLSYQSKIGHQLGVIKNLHWRNLVLLYDFRYVSWSTLTLKCNILMMWANKFTNGV
jgi:hypothetical protein